MRLQDKQASEQALSQQTPCAQNPEAHSVPEAQSAPRGLRPQEPFAQIPPGVHSAALLHVLKQTSPLQMYGLQARAREGTHWPEALQVGGGL